MIIDTHCHYNLEPLYGATGTDWQTHWQKAQEHGVTHSVVIGTDLASSERALALCQKEPHFKATAGLHPHLVADALQTQPEFGLAAIDTWAEQLEKLITTDNAPGAVVAIGEIGLDYFRVDLADPAAQKEVSLQKYLCTKQLEIAQAHELPVTLHVRDRGEHAYTDILELLQRHRHSNLPFILHCASGSLSYIQAALAMGAYVGIAGNVTYKNASAIRAIVGIVPADRLLLETDAPYLPPTPYRGATCEPWMIELTGIYLKENCQVSLERVYSNTLQVFTSLDNS